jgi:hypothetical protein
MSALTPFPKLLLALVEGEPSNDIIGRRYERVLPVPVGDIAARSRDYEPSGKII